MKKLLLATLIVAATLTGCVVANGTHDSNKANVSKTETLGAFDCIVSDAIVDIDIIYTADSTNSIVYDMSPNLLDITAATIDGSTLTVKHTGNNPRHNKFEKEQITIYTNSPIKKCVVNGVGDIDLYKGTTAIDFNIELNGVGDIDVRDIKARSVSARLDGVGDINLKGTTESASYILSGTGDIEAKHLIANSVTANNSGVGDIECHASTSIEANCSGVGDVEYYGNPATTNLKGNNITRK